MAFGGSAGAANYNNTSPTSGTGPNYTLGTGDTLTNSSSITGTGASSPAVRANNGASSISNSGLIQATGANGIGIQVVSGGSVGTITNSGTIQTTTSGSAIVVGDTIGPVGSVGTLTNSGLIQSTGTNAAIQVNSFGSITSIANLSGGTIQALGTGNAINALGTIGSISNSGQILASQGTAIAIGSTGIIVNGITNTATGLIQGGPGNGSGVAIDDSAGTHALTITTAGTVIGQIKLGPAGDTLNVTGGSVTGAIIGQSGSNDILNFSPTGTFTTAGSIANVDTINVNTNTLVLQNPVSGAIAFNVAAAANVGLNANVGALTFTNAGMVNVGSGNPTITGNYVQTSSGSLGVTVTGASGGTLAVGKLTVNGNATLQGGGNTISVNVPNSTNPLALPGNSGIVLSATTVVSTGSLSAVSNNPNSSFGLSETANTVVLTALALSPSQVAGAAAQDVNFIFAPVSSTATTNDLQVQAFVKSVLAGLALSGQSQLASSIVNTLNTLTPAGLVQLEKQLAPSTINNSTLSISAAANTLTSALSTISGRLALLRLNPSQSGLAAGDEVGRGITMWGQPFGAVSSQGAVAGIDGYNVGTYGATLGGDMLVTSNLRLGLALTLANSNITYNGSTSGNTGSIFNTQLTLYGQWFQQSFFVDGALAFGYSHYTRHDLVAAFPGVALDSDNGGTQLSAKLGAGYDWKVNGAIVTPYVSVQPVHFNFGSYTESGGSAFGLDMHVNGQSADMTETRLGARLAYPVQLANGGGTLTPEVHAYYLHDFGNNQLNATYTTADFVSPTTYVFYGPPIGRDIANAGLSMTFAQGPGWSFAGGYDYAGRASASSNNFYVNLKINF